MLTILQQPNTVVYSKNPIVFKIQTDNYVTDEGEYAISGFIGFNDPALGGTLTFGYGDNEIVFTFRNTLDSSGATIRTNSDSLVVFDYLNDVVIPDLKSNNDLYSDFFIEYYYYLGTHHTIKFTARNKGADYDLTFTPSVHSDVTITPIVPTLGADRAVRENFKIFCEVFVSNDVTSTSETAFYKVLSFEQIPDNENTCEFDLSEVLASYVNSTKPATNQTEREGSDARNYYKNTALKYYIRYGESYGIPTKDYITFNTLSSTLYVLYGGVDKIAVPGYSLYTELFTNKKTILTTQPTIRYVSKTSPAILYWVNTISGALNFRTNFKFYYSDGTTEDTLLLYSLNSGNNKSMIIHSVPVHYKQLEALISSGKTLVKYDVTIYRNGSPATLASQTITYIIDDLNYENERNFIYKNSAGGYEILRATGVLDYTPEFTSDEGMRVLPSNYTVSDGESRSFNSFVSHPYKLSTGFHSLKEIQSYEDFFLSEEVFLITSDNIHLPVRITSKKADMPGDNSQTFALAFEYELKYQDNSYTLR